MYISIIKAKITNHLRKGCESDLSGPLAFFCKVKKVLALKLWDSCHRKCGSKKLKGLLSWVKRLLCWQTLIESMFLETLESKEIKLQRPGMCLMKQEVVKFWLKSAPVICLLDSYPPFPNSTVVIGMVDWTPEAVGWCHKVKYEPFNQTRGCAFWLVGWLPKGPAERLALVLPSLGRRDISTQIYIKAFKDIYHL